MHKNFWFSLAVIWSGIILFLCLINNAELPELSLKVDGIDKIVHFTFHFIFTLLWVIYLKSIKNYSVKSLILRVILFSILFGIIIEILQGFLTTTRKADVLDILANTIGAITAGLVLYFMLNRINKLKTL